MTPEELVATTDGGTNALEAVPDLELRMVDPEAIAVDPMNERTDEPLETQELERSVAVNGVVDPPVCRVRDPDARVPYAVVQGQRRVTAAQAVQLDEIPILIGEFDDKRALIRSITENIKAGRKDVTTKTRAAAIASGDTAEELARRVIDEELSKRDVHEAVKQPYAEEDPFQALEEVKRAKEASEEARGFMLDRMRFGDETGGAIEQAARATGKDKSAVIKDAVQYYLREEGFL